MTDEQLALGRARLKFQRECFLEQLGDQRVMMTDATELLYGTSGRGSPTAKAFVRKYASDGLVRIERRGAR